MACVRVYLLPGQDSNLRPIDYTYSYVTVWRGLYHHRLYCYTDGARRFECICVHPTPRRDSLWTFNWIAPKAWLLIALANAIGVPAIHLVCNIDFSIRLLFWTWFNVTVDCSTAELPRKVATCFKASGSIVQKFGGYSTRGTGTGFW